VQENHRAGGQGEQLGLHAGKVHAAGGRVVVRVGLHREARGLEQGAVVFPGGVADVDRGARVEALEEVGADAQGAGAADTLGGDHAAGSDQIGAGAEQQVLHGLSVGGRTFDGLVATGRSRFQTGLFSSLDGGQQRNLAVVVVVHANAQVHLGGAGVGVEGFGQSENRIPRGHLDGGEDRGSHRCSRKLQK